MVLQNQMHPLQAKVILGTEMVFTTTLFEQNGLFGLKLKHMICCLSVSDLLDYINPDQYAKGRDAQKRRRAKVLTASLSALTSVANKEYSCAQISQIPPKSIEDRSGY